MKSGASDPFAEESSETVDADDADEEVGADEEMGNEKTVDEEAVDGEAVDGEAEVDETEAVETQASKAEVGEAEAGAGDSGRAVDGVDDVTDGVREAKAGIEVSEAGDWRVREGEEGEDGGNEEDGTRASNSEAIDHGTVGRGTDGRGTVDRSQIPWLLRRDSVKGDRPHVHQLFVRDDTDRKARRAESDLEELLATDVYRLDAREALYLVGMRHLDEAAELLEEWGYNF